MFVRSSNCGAVALYIITQRTAPAVRLDWFVVVEKQYAEKFKLPLVNKEVLYLQPMITPKRFDIFPPYWGMPRRSRCVQIFFQKIYFRIEPPEQFDGLIDWFVHSACCPCNSEETTVTQIISRRHVKSSANPARGHEKEVRKPNGSHLCGNQLLSSNQQVISAKKTETMCMPPPRTMMRVEAAEKIYKQVQSFIYLL